MGSARKVSLERSHQTRDKGGGLKPGRAFGDAPGEPALSLASASPSSELGRLEQSRCTCCYAVLERLGSCSPVRARPCHCRCTGSRRPCIASTEAQTTPLRPGDLPRRRLWRPRRPRSPRLRCRSASPVAACNVLVVLGRRGAAMHARSAGVKVILIVRDTLLSCVLRALNLEWNGAVVFNEEDSRF